MGTAWWTVAQWCSEKRPLSDCWPGPSPADYPAFLSCLPDSSLDSALSVLLSDLPSVGHLRQRIAFRSQLLTHRGQPNSFSCVARDARLEPCCIPSTHDHPHGHRESSGRLV